MRRAWIFALASFACAAGATTVNAQEQALPQAEATVAAPAVLPFAPPPAMAVQRPVQVSPSGFGSAHGPIDLPRALPAQVSYSENDRAGQSDSQGRSRVPPPRTGGSSGSSGGSGSGGRPPATSGSSGRSGGSSGTRRGRPSRASATRTRAVTGPTTPGARCPAEACRATPSTGLPYHPWYGSWYPWGFGSWGLGFYFWDPYWYGGWGYSPYAYGYGYAGGSYYDTGSVKLLIKPRDAQVFVDGYYVGIVDEFDGSFQRLKLDEGPHRIEVRKEGFETLQLRRACHLRPHHQAARRAEARGPVTGRRRRHGHRRTARGRSFPGR